MGLINIEWTKVCAFVIVEQVCCHLRLLKLQMPVPEVHSMLFLEVGDLDNATKLLIAYIVSLSLKVC